MAHLSLYAAADEDSALDLDGLMKSFVALSLLIALVTVWGISNRPDPSRFDSSVSSGSRAELSREWLWKMPATNFDQMFRQVY